jgi:anti-anti-sigma regulatory factor
VRALTEVDEPPHVVVLSFEGVNFIDSQGAEQLAAIHELVEGAGATLRLAQVKPQVLAVLREDGFVGHIDRPVEVHA